jgi:hypothetical protein
MNKTITEAQVKIIMDAFYQCNAPVQMFNGLQKMLNELPANEVQEESDEPKSN